MLTGENGGGSGDDWDLRLDVKKVKRFISRTSV